MLAWTIQIKCRGLCEQSNDIRMATRSYNIKLVIGIILINVNHNSPALERSSIDTCNLEGVGLKKVSLIFTSAIFNLVQYIN